MTKQTPSDPLGEIMGNDPMTRPPLDEFLAQATPTMGRPPAALTDLATDLTVRPIWDMGQGVGAALQGNLGAEVGTGLLSALGIFAGPGARTANRGALRLAEEMERRGMSREQIWDATGWFKGADKGWRFEIPDDALQIRAGMGSGMGPDRPVHHPALQAAYPEQSSELHTSAWLTGRPDELQGGFGVSEGRRPRIIMMAGSNDKLRSGVAHELQHFVQANEGFARGGNPNTIAQQIPESVLRTLTPRQRENAVQTAYERLAGEVEARNVQTRLNMTPEQRQRSYPWTTEDTPPEHQIVAGVRLVPVNHDPFK